MKILHMADMHFDSPFCVLNSRRNLGETRRLEQRNVFKNIIKYVKDNNVDYMLISGDFYEHEYIRKSTVEFINNQFKEIPHTKIFITPGNHDPYIKGSIYDTYEFEKNVHIFKKPEIEKYEDDFVCIYGMGFDGFYMNYTPLENVQIENKDKINILMAHADVNGARDAEGFAYNPIAERYLKDTGFKYIALGHIHKNNFEDNEDFVYPGSTISFGFDELGEHGVVVVEIDSTGVTKEFVKFDNREFDEIVVDVDSFNSKEDLIEYVLDLDLKKEFMYKINLVGKRSFEIVPREIIKYLEGKNVIKIKDCTQLSYDLEELAKENTLKGIFVKKVLEKAPKEDLTEEEIAKIIEIGLESME